MEDSNSSASSQKFNIRKICYLGKNSQEKQIQAWNSLEKGKKRQWSNHDPKARQIQKNNMGVYQALIKSTSQRPPGTRMPVGSKQCSSNPYGTKRFENLQQKLIEQLQKAKKVAQEKYDKAFEDYKMANTKKNEGFALYQKAKAQKDPDVEEFKAYYLQADLFLKDCREKMKRCEKDLDKAMENLKKAESRWEKEKGQAKEAEEPNIKYAKKEEAPQ